MKLWWMNLSQREQRVLMAGAIAVLALLLWRGVWTPINTRVHALRQRVVARQSELTWMQGAAAQIRQLRAEAGPRGNGGTGLIDVVDRAAKRNGIRSALTRMSPQGNNRLAVDLGKVDFDGLMRWLAALQQAGVTVHTLAVNRSDTPGVVQAHCVVGRG